MKFEADLIASTPAGQSEAAKQLQSLETQLDRTIIQYNEALQIQKIYRGILDKLQQVNNNNTLLT